MAGTSVVPRWAVELGRQVDGILVFHKAGFLHETLVGGVEHVLHKVVFQHTAYPYARHQKKDVPGGQRYRVNGGIDRRIERRQTGKVLLWEVQSMTECWLR